MVITKKTLWSILFAITTLGVMSIVGLKVIGVHIFFQWLISLLTVTVIIVGVSADSLYIPSACSCVPVIQGSTINLLTPGHYCVVLPKIFGKAQILGTGWAPQPSRNSTLVFQKGEKTLGEVTYKGWLVPSPEYVKFLEKQLQYAVCHTTDKEALATYAATEFSDIVRTELDRLQNILEAHLRHYGFSTLYDTPQRVSGLALPFGNKNKSLPLDHTFRAYTTSV